MKPNYLILLIILSSVSKLFAQEVIDSCHVENKKAMKNFDEAKKLLKDNKFADAIEKLEAAVEEEPLFQKAYYILGKVYEERDNYEKAIESYVLAIEICWAENAEAMLNVGDMTFEMEDWEKAAEYYGLYIDHPLKKPEKATVAEEKMNRAKFFNEVYSNPVPYDPKPVPNVSTIKEEYLPMLSPDNDYLYFTRKYEKKNKGDMFARQVEDFSVSERQGDQFTAGIALPDPFNLGYNQGGASVTIDNSEMFVTVCNSPGVIGQCDIYYTTYVDGFWRDLQNMGDSVNTEFWESQASISSDGKTLYFASDRDSLTGQDIYKIVREDKGKPWSSPVKLGPSINTDLDEKSPFIHPDNNTLYFSSQGHNHLGGFDIFYSRVKDNGDWGKANNIGYPINSDADDLGFFVSTDGSTAYFSSNKLKEIGLGGYDIYYFPLYEEARPKKVLFMKGELRDMDGTVIQGAKFELRDLQTNETTEIEVDSNSGKYVFAKTIENDMMLSIQKQGFFYESQYISKEDSIFMRPVMMDFKMNSLKIGESFIARNILFSIDSYELTEKAIKELNNLLELLEFNPTLKIAINGYTDNVGNDASNLTLSDNRARIVYEWLISNGIEKSRLNYKGYGETEPMKSNDSEEGRQQNRRTEITIKGM